MVCISASSVALTSWFFREATSLWITVVGLDVLLCSTPIGLVERLIIQVDCGVSNWLIAPTPCGSRLQLILTGSTSSTVDEGRSCIMAHDVHV